ncbi:Kinesin-14 [Giardia muris]|uniref:Kinesin-like protein n=1 Tax=Giardia muris TaxID=5742 RepID=A0A4Z1SNH4_GIAMU|nr:Kinesin-14 [Giardia muris]|eukprot:TNJ27324.1 Kinesin-14 [Giardia muris]
MAVALRASTVEKDPRELTEPSVKHGARADESGQKPIISSVNADRRRHKGTTSLRQAALLAARQSTDDSRVSQMETLSLLERLEQFDPGQSLASVRAQEFQEVSDQLHKETLLGKALKAENEALQRENADLRQKWEQLLREHSTLQAKHRELEQDMESMMSNATAVGDNVQALQAEIERLLEQRQRDIVERRRLHNTIQDLRGAIRVYVRLRPLACDTPEGLDPNGIRYELTDQHSDKRLLTAIGRPERSLDGQKVRRMEYAFEFDRVFPMTATQQDVWDDVSELVQSALDGYRVCIFAYGQTASGKTHTMLGPATKEWSAIPEADKGIMPRAAEQIFAYSRDTARDMWNYTLLASFYEIYNDSVRDLLAKGGPQEKHQVIRDATGGTRVDGLVKHPVKSADELNWLLCQAFNNRAVGSTEMNARSSRSHAILQVDIAGENRLSGEKISSTLNLIDLAGSENVERSGATGERLQEAISINKSLTALSSVIGSLVTKATHIPYRDSKLTSLLQPSLSGDSKTMVIITLSPDECNFAESVNSLRFAAKIAGVEVSGKHRAVPTGSGEKQRR